VVQRTCRGQAGGRVAPWFVFWGYQLFIVLAATGYLLGITQGKEYAEPEWYVDLWLTIVWVAYLLVFLGTIWKRKEPHIYVANWFYLAFIVTIAMLHMVNNLACRSASLNQSYGVFAGVQDALTQWWYGHNAVGFFLTAGFLAMMYYFVPKQAERPVYSYRLSIVHFWALIFIYIWAGPHHLHYTALPRVGADPGHDLLDHAVDALLGRHDQRPDDPVGRLGQAAHRSGHADAGGLVAFYGMSTFEGPVMSIRRSTRSATTPTGPSATCTPARWAGSASSASARSIAWCRGCGRSERLYSTSWSSGTSGSRPSASCSTSPRCGSRASWRA
jgi:cytochrome c oxidase cbb3-type subunit I